MTDPRRPPIRRLPPVLANQIAAGEVVERPAAVVKELLENSLDAGAQRIRVDVEGGGADLVRVRDDGVGIPADQLALALDRHATSKLASADDLGAIATLGFRGEALPSIASVARVRLVSRAAGAAHGASIAVDGSAEPTSPLPAQHPPGTTVEVRDLFFNTPARRRFLRTARTETMHIENAVRRTALAAPGLGLELWVGDRRVLFARPQGTDSRRWLQQLVGRSFADRAIALHERAGSFGLYGWIDGAGGRAHADVQHLVVNGRPVNDSLLRHAVRSALAPGLVDGRLPAYVLALELPPTGLDVNVHPTKHEVRFHEPRQVHDFIVSTLMAVIAGGQSHADLLGPSDASTSPTERGGSGHGAGVGAYGAPAPADARAGRNPAPHPLAGGLRGVMDSTAPYARGSPALGRWVRELAPGYALTESVDELLVVSVSRLGSACVRAALVWAEQSPPTAAGTTAPAGEDPPALESAWSPHPLLLPHPWALPGAAADQVIAAEATTRAFGLSVRQAAPDELMLLTVPRLLAGIEPVLFVEALGSWLERGADRKAMEDALARLVAQAGARVGSDIVKRWLACCPADVLPDEVARRLDSTALMQWFGD
ncbi:MAG: DNA mismatch repair endonuclease MutL [Pseudomonadota bacterium]